MMSHPNPYSASWQPRNQNREWKKKVQNKWSARLDQLFSGNVPNQKRWTSPEAIAYMIDEVADPEGSDEQTHAWLNYPDSGDKGLYGAAMHEEEECIILETSPDQGAGTLLRPEYLEVNVPDNNRKLSYFWLQAQKLHPSGIYDDRSDAIFEEVCEVHPGEYRKRDLYDQSEMINPDGANTPLPSNARPVMRYFEGSFLISCKASPYIQNAPVGRPNPSKGMHADMGSDDFREFMLWLSQET